MAIKLGLVGVGVIARAQHLPVIAESPAFELVAAASRNAKVDGVANYTNLADLLQSSPETDAVALCAPPIARTQDARLALKAGKYVLLEKPPGATLSEVHDLIALAREQRVTLLASWHSRHARAVGPARDWLRHRTIRSVEVNWREDIRVWHPGQDWILAPGGLGVFDPGINALSILTHILPAPFALRSGKLGFPGNRQAPIHADLAFADANGAPIRAIFDFLQTGPQTWDIRVETDDGLLVLSQGGALAHIDGAAMPLAPETELLRSEYAGVYAHFADLIATGRSDVDVAPLAHVADAFMLGERVTALDFSF